MSPKSKRISKKNIQLEDDWKSLNKTQSRAKSGVKDKDKNLKIHLDFNQLAESDNEMSYS